MFQNSADLPDVVMEGRASAQALAISAELWQLWGDIEEGDLFAALELGVKITPRTENSGFSKVTLWHNDGTSDGLPINGSNGPEGWGYFLLHEQELSSDGNLVSVFKGGQAFDDSAYFKSQVSASLLLYDPSFIGTIKHDVVGVSVNWVDPVAEDSRDESNVEAIYRFPFFPALDTTFSYMAVINPALDPNNDFASVFSLRLSTAF